MAILIIANDSQEIERVDNLLNEHGFKWFSGKSLLDRDVLNADPNLHRIVTEHGILYGPASGETKIVYMASSICASTISKFPGARELPPVGPFTYNNTPLKVDGDTRRVPNNGDYFLTLIGRVEKRDVTYPLKADETHGARRWCLKVAKPEGPFIFEGREYEIDGDEKRYEQPGQVYLNRGKSSCNRCGEIAGTPENIGEPAWILRPIISDELQAAIDHEKQCSTVWNEAETALQQATLRREELENKK